MLTDTKRYERLHAYAKGLGIDGDSVAVQFTRKSVTRVKAGDNGEVDYIAIANTDDIDLDEEVVVPAGADKTYIEANKMMFADHNYGTMDVVGKIRAITRYPDGLPQTAWRVRFRLADTEVGKATRAIIDKFGDIGLSVGFFARDYGPPTPEEKKAYTKGGKTPNAVIRKWDWFELSTTPLPSNRACRVIGGEGSAKYASDIEGMVTKGLISRVGAARLGLPIGEERKVFAMPRTMLLPTGEALIRRS